MAARVCSACGIAFPLSEEQCQACGSATSQVMDVFPDNDWKKRVKQTIEEREEAVRRDAPDKTVLNRAKRMHDAGLDWGKAIETAALRGDEGGYLVDIREFERLVGRGCPAGRAADILGLGSET